MVQDGSIFCELHGQQSSAALCSHLVKGAGLGFNAGDPTPENPSPDAFCDTCWKILEEENGWSDRAQRLVPCSIVCGVCYIGIRLRNIVEWEFPEIGVDIRSDLAARQSLLCAACGVATDMESGKVSFVFPPHAAMSPDLIAWTTSTDNLVLLCSKCFDGINGNRNLVTIRFRTSSDTLGASALARPLGSSCYRLLQKGPGEACGKPGDVVFAPLEQEDANNKTSGRYFIYKKLID